MLEIDIGLIDVTYVGVPATVEGNRTIVPHFPGAVQSDFIPSGTVRPCIFEVLISRIQVTDPRVSRFAAKGK